MDSKWIAPYILRTEYECPHCHRLPFALEEVGKVVYPYTVLFESFARIREAWGRPLKISSGYRCSIYNRLVGGVDLSVHLFGLALDLDVLSIVEVVELECLIEEVAPELRRGVYTSKGTFIHVDVGYLIEPQVLSQWHMGARWEG